MRLSAWRVIATLAVCAAAALRAGAETRDGATVYVDECAACHDQAAPRVPSRAALAERAPGAIVQALESGAMRVVGTFNLNGPERVAVAEYLSGRDYDPGWAQSAGASCAPSSWPPPDAATQPAWSGWGNGAANTRFQRADAAGLSRETVPALELAWAFAFPGETIAESQPTIYGGRLFVGSRSGRVYALDAASGCIHWTFDAAAPVKSSLLIAPVAGRSGAFFSDLGGTTYGLDAATGELLWRVRVEDSDMARIMGTLQYADGDLLVPMTSTESYLAADVERPCCVFRGSVTAIDPATGATRWRYYTVAEPQPTGTTASGVASFGPSGATIWSTPTYDAVHGRVYVGTGENYSNPPTATSDAILAVERDTQALAWHFQGLAGDAWNMSCNTDNPLNCPDDAGPDFDFGASPILATHASGRRVVIAGQKSGIVYALDPDDGGRLLWQRQIARGGILGGIEWGPAADTRRVYVAIADIDWETPDLMQPDLALDGGAGGGLLALDLLTGDIAWDAAGVDCSGRERCSPAQTAAVTAIPGVVFSGSVSGDLRAFDADTGDVIWSFDTARRFETVNGAAGRGGALDATGPVVAGGWLYTVSGYSKWGGLPGNVLLAFRPRP